MMHILDDSSFESEVLNESNKAVLVDFYADWCGPCKSLGPILEELSDELTDLKFTKINVDSSTVAKKYRVMSIPTVILFKNGEVADKFTGLMDKDAIKAFIDKNK